jgi:PEP-CTERM motif
MNVMKTIAGLVLAGAALAAQAAPYRIDIAHAGTVGSAFGNDVEPGAAYTFSMSFTYDTDLIQPGAPEQLRIGDGSASLRIAGTEYAFDFSRFDTLTLYFNNYETYTDVFLVARTSAFQDDGQALTTQFSVPDSNLGSLLYAPFSFTAAAPAVIGGAMSIREFGQTVSGATLAANTLSVTISAVPEPGTGTMVIAGLGVVGWAARRRQAVAA